MKTHDVDESVRSWFERLLCRRHVAAVFSSLALLLKDAPAGQTPTIWWALGGLNDGEAEVLGAWLNEDPGGGVPLEALGDLYQRGAEFIRLGVGDLGPAGAEFTRTFRCSAVAASVEQTLASTVARVPPRFRSLLAEELQAVADAADLDSARAELARFQTTSLSEGYPWIAEHWGEAVARFGPLFALPAPMQRLARSTDRSALEVNERLKRAVHRHGPFDDRAAALEFVARKLDRAECRLDRERDAARAARDVRAIAAERPVRTEPPGVTA